MKKCIVLVVSFVAMAMYAQAPDTLWTRTYGGAGNDGANSILQTSDGGYIVAGYTDWDLWILRLDSSGDTLWTKTYSGPHYAASIQHTTDSGYIIAGGAYPDEVWLLKTDSLGDTLWTNSWPQSSRRWAGGNDVIQTSDGGYVIAGWWAPWYWNGGLVLRTDSLGDMLWMNDDVGQYCNAVQETSDSNYFVGGIHGWGASGMNPAFGLSIVDPQGTVLWSHAYYTFDPPNAGECNDVLVTSDGHLTACGGYGEGDYDIYLVRTDANGDTLWTKLFCEGIAYSLDRRSDGGYIVVGETSGDAVCIGTDSLGDTLWTAVYGGPEHDVFYSVLQTSDGGCIMAGETNSFGAGGADVWIVKLGPGVGVEENKNIVFENENRTTTIFSGQLQLPKGKKCEVFDITGRVVDPQRIQPGIYFIEVDGVVTQKVVKVR